MYIVILHYYLSQPFATKTLIFAICDFELILWVFWYVKFCSFLWFVNLSCFEVLRFVHFLWFVNFGWFLSFKICSFLRFVNLGCFLGFKICSFLRFEIFWSVKKLIFYIFLRFGIFWVWKTQNETKFCEKCSKEPHYTLLILYIFKMQLIFTYRKHIMQFQHYKWCIRWCISWYAWGYSQWFAWNYTRKSQIAPPKVNERVYGTH